MKTTTLAAVAVLSLLSSAAFSADLPVKARPAPPAAAFSWTGFYVGVHGGGMWADKDWTENCSALVGAPCVGLAAGTPFRTSHQISSGIAGGQIGYNWQVNNFVLGIEGDASGAWGNEACSAIVGPPSFFAISTSSGCSKIDWLATVTGRAGIAFGQALFYGKGGVAFAHDTYVVRCGLTGGLCVPASRVMTTSPSDDRIGWTVGVGIEYAVTPNWSLKGEYNYMDFGTERSRFQTTIFAPNDSIHDIDIRQRVSVAKIGLNYRFGSPVVAKY